MMYSFFNFLLYLPLLLGSYSDAFLINSPKRAPSFTEIKPTVSKSKKRAERRFSSLKNDKRKAENGFLSHLQDSLNSLAGGIFLFSTILFAPVDIGINSGSSRPFIELTYSKVWALTENQQQVSDVWFAVSSQYFDPTYNGLGEKGWREKRNEAVKTVEDFGPDDQKEVEKSIQKMLSSLGDPYTRFLPREKYESLSNYARGESAGGIGVQLLLEPRENKVMVMGVSEGSPAKVAGLVPGDIIIEVDGESMEGSSADVVAARCRGESGTKMAVRVQHQGKTSTDLYNIVRSTVKVNPVEKSTYISSDTNQKIGLLKLSAFSKETAGQVIDAIRAVKADGAETIAIDLRGNVGGYMPAGIDAAKLFLPARAHVIAEVNRAGTITGYDADGIGADTSIPIFILVDNRTASAAEIFTAALQDNRRALVVGTTKTFGKGRIQNVQSLQDGSGVAVTRARYLTPSGRDLHGVGITPNKIPESCNTEDSARTCLLGIV